MSAANWLRSRLAHPLTRGLDIDDLRTTELRRRIIQQKPFLRRIYEEWYRALAGVVPQQPQPALELGSGAGFLEQFIPNLIRSEIFASPRVRLVLDAQRLPLADQSLRAIVMTNVLHHLPRVREFFVESSRCVQPGGVISMIEPWVTPWARLVYTRLHHEPFDPHAPAWEFPSHGPLSGANGAVPWIIFQRDRAKFEVEFPQWRIQSIRPLMPIRYLLSGGVSMRNLMPGFSFGFWRAIETSIDQRGAMFAQITLVRA